IRWILDNERYDKTFLGAPGPAAMAAAGEAAWTNATHLIVSDPEHPRFGTCLRGSDMGWEDAPEDPYVVRLPDGSLAPHTGAAPAQILVDETIDVPGLGSVAVRSALAMLHQSVSEKSLADYSE